MKSLSLVLLIIASIVTTAGTASRAANQLSADIPGRPSDNRDPVRSERTPKQDQPIPAAPDIQSALRLAQAIATGCKEYPLGVAVVNSEGSPLLIYIPDGTDPRHGDTAVRKAYSAIRFAVDTSALAAQGQQDSAVAGQIAADSKVIARPGGLLLTSHEKIIGAVGVSGAEPGHHDEDCAKRGLATVGFVRAYAPTVKY